MAITMPFIERSHRWVGESWMKEIQGILVELFFTYRRCIFDSILFVVIVH